MRRLLPPALVAAALLAAGCGSSGHDNAQTAVLAPQAVLDQYRAAILDGDGSAACSVLSAMAKNDVEADGSRCTERLGAIAEHNTSDDKRALKAMRPRIVVRGIKAVAEFRTLGGNPTRIVLEKEGTAGWKVIDSPELENVRTSNRVS